MTMDGGGKRRNRVLAFSLLEPGSWLTETEWRAQRISRCMELSISNSNGTVRLLIPQSSNRHFSTGKLKRKKIELSSFFLFLFWNLTMDVKCCINIQISITWRNLLLTVHLTVYILLHSTSKNWKQMKKNEKNDIMNSSGAWGSNKKGPTKVRIKKYTTKLFREGHFVIQRTIRT
jgi:uncharacterized protein YhhL (DUF1145 family)